MLDQERGMRLKLDQFDYGAVKRVEQNGHRHYTDAQGNRMPSVTTILGKTKDLAPLLAWRKRIGESAANQVTRESADLGTMMHTHLEHHILGTSRPSGSNVGRLMAKNMADVIINHGLCDVQEVWGVEVPLLYETFWAGTTDLVGLHAGEPAIMDFKTTIRPKTRERVEDYRMQLCAYIAAHNWMFGTNIKKGVIFMCSRDLEYQEFVWNVDDYEKNFVDWLLRVEAYYHLT